MSLFRESYLTSYGDNEVLSTGNSRISKNSLFVECRLPYSKGGYSPALVLNKENTGLYEVVLSNSKSGDKKSMGFLERKGDGTSRLFINNCSLDLNSYDSVCINMNGRVVLCGKFRLPSGWY